MDDEHQGRARDGPADVPRGPQARVRCPARRAIIVPDDGGRILQWDGSTRSSLRLLLRRSSLRPDSRGAAEVLRALRHPPGRQQPAGVAAGRRGVPLKGEDQTRAHRTDFGQKHPGKRRGDAGRVRAVHARDVRGAQGEEGEERDEERGEGGDGVRRVRLHPQVAAERFRVVAVGAAAPAARTTRGEHSCAARAVCIHVVRVRQL
mmetsp:Transcript_8122/g.36984  ORF Transcript_8122/g.36984 Transcript_8122/m.36984 type:complete len:205 (-) Transcript_8122:962-1576(-)